MRTGEIPVLSRQTDEEAGKRLSHCVSDTGGKQGKRKVSEATEERSSRKEGVIGNGNQQESKCFPHTALCSTLSTRHITSLNSPNNAMKWVLSSPHVLD